MTHTSAANKSTFPHTEGLQIAVDHTPAQADNMPHVMFCGGFHSAMLGTKATALKEHCLQHGLRYTRFDYRGHGQSEGDPAHFTIADWLQDTLAVLDQYAAPTLLVGSSMGAWLATLAALRRPDTVKALLLLAAAPDFLAELVTPKLTTADVWDLQQGQTVAMDNAYDTPHPITQALLDSGHQLSLLQGNSLDKLYCPMHLMHGTADNDVPFDLAVRLMSKLPADHNAELSLLHGADHRLSDARSLAHMQKEIEILVKYISTNG